MKRNDLMKFNLQLGISIELDSEMRRLQELIKLAYRFGKDELITSISSRVSELNQSVNDLLYQNVVDDVEE